MTSADPSAPPPAAVETLLCEVCSDLEQRGREARSDTRSLNLSRLIDHHIKVHGATGEHRPACQQCADWENPRGIATPLAAWWSRRHYVSHELGIVRRPDGLHFAEANERRRPPQPGAP